MKKKFSLKDIQIYIAIGGLLVGLVTTFVKLSISAENTTKKVDKLETKLEEAGKETDKEISELKEDSQALDKSLEVSKVQQEAIKKEIEDTNKKVDKVIELLLDIKERKK